MSSSSSRESSSNSSGAAEPTLKSVITRPEPSGKPEAPCQSEEAYAVLRRLIKCIEDKKRADAVGEKKLQTRTSPEALEAYKIMEQFLQDAESMMTFSASLYVKDFVFSVVVELVQSSRSDEFTKMSLGVFKRLLDYEFNEEEDKFVVASHVATLYAPTFIRLMPFLNDIAVEESFYADDEEDQSAFQKDLLLLIFYMFKTISLRKLISLGFKPRHLQFIIIHFTNSVHIPRIIHSIAANLDGKTELDDSDDGADEMVDEGIFNQRRLSINNIYSISVRSCLLLHRYHADNRETSAMLRNAFRHLASYADKSKAADEHCQETELMLQKMARKVVSHFRKKLSQIMNTHFLRFDYELVADYLKMIEFNIGNMSVTSRGDLVQKLVGHVKRILERISNQNAQTVEMTHLADSCFALINRLIKVSRDEFITIHLKCFEATWCSYLVQNNKMAFVALITLLEEKIRKAPFMMFIRRFILVAADRIHEKSCHVLLYFKPLIMLYEHYTNDSLVCDERRIKSLLESFRAILHRQAKTNKHFLNVYLDVVDNLLRIDGGGDQSSQERLIDELIDVLERLMRLGFQFSMNWETTNKCLEIVNRLESNYSCLASMARHGSLLYELLSRIRESWFNESWEFKSRIASYQDALSSLNWIK